MLDQDQIQFFKDHGYVKLAPFPIDQATIDGLKEHISFVNDNVTHPSVYRYGANDTVFKIRGMHLKDAPTYTPLMETTVAALKPTAAELIGDDAIYVTQSKLVTKMSGNGEYWSWHTDFDTWLPQNFPKASLVMLVVLLDDTDSSMGPFTAVPKTHKIDLPYDHTLIGPKPTLYSYCTPEDVAEEQVEKYGKVQFVGPAGTCYAVHCKTLHMSGVNTSDRHRRLLEIVYNPISNKPDAKLVEKIPSWALTKD